MDPILGQICEFGFNFVPKDFKYCDGSLMSVQQNTALFSLLGTAHGGDGRETFAVPDYRATDANGNKLSFQDAAQRGLAIKCIAVQGMYPMRD